MKSLRRRWLFLVVLLVGVGVLLVWLVESQQSSAAFALSGTVRRPRETGHGRPLQMAFVRPGDHLHFRVSSRRAGFLAVVGVGGQTGRETAVYYPPAPDAAPLGAGEATELPSPIVPMNGSATSLFTVSSARRRFRWRRFASDSHKRSVRCRTTV